MRAMTWWQFNEVVDGWMSAHNPDKGGLSEAEEEGLWAAVQMG